MQTQEELIEQLSVDVEGIATQLNEGFGLTHKRQSGAQPALVRWVDFRLRWVDPRPRVVHLSNRFPKSLDGLTGKALRALTEAIRNGDDVNPFQSKGLFRTDSSGKRRPDRTDLLWADWGIHHLHVTEKRGEETYFSARSDYLLFVWFGPDHALLLDVLPHSGDALRFSREELIRVVAQNWPEVLAPFEIPGRSLERLPTDEERHMLRRAGIDTPLSLEGKLYFPPDHGVTSASTPGKVTDYVFRMRRNLRAITDDILNPSGQFLTMVPETSRSSSHFSLQLTRAGIVIYEKQTDHGWTFPDAKMVGPNTAYAELSDALTPPWVKKALTEG
ncbi:hypothetical protein [Caballeronia mineralivorans]|uniref:hypothetical protein n=1 Tax=Caballeronia mineralivorans TaxID=2010198 RepID=UPI0023F3E6EA|nr:hypothetical protein [Caballeronia mineralivorans]MDB5782323.1 hypothetical protein [Caballeronia mineralivorans]